MNKKILIDMDNTLTKIDYTLRSFEKYYNLPFKRVSEIYSFNLPLVYGVSTKEASNFWKNCEEDIVINSQLNYSIYNEIYSSITKNDEVYIVTARDSSLHELTKKWLIRNNVFFNELHCIGKSMCKSEWAKKNNLFFDVVYEDNPSFLSKLSKKTKKVVIDYPYNRNIISDERLLP